MAKKKTAPRKTTAVVRKGGPILAVTKLATEIRDLIHAARGHVSTTATLALVNLYWNIGRIIAQELQKDPVETVGYEGVFKDPYVLDFLGLKGAYSEKDLEERLKMYSKLLRDRDRASAGQAG